MHSFIASAQLRSCHEHQDGISRRYPHTSLRSFARECLGMVVSMQWTMTGLFSDPFVSGYCLIEVSEVMCMAVHCIPCCDVHSVQITF